MSTKLEIAKVNRYEAEWDPKTLFNGFTIRAVLTEQRDMVTRIQAVAQLRKRLNREMGEDQEGETWLLQENARTGENELYLLNAGKLIMWKLQDFDKFNGLFDRVEQHKDNLDDEVRDDEG